MEDGIGISLPGVLLVLALGVTAYLGLVEPLTLEPLVVATLFILEVLLTLAIG